MATQLIPASRPTSVERSIVPPQSQPLPESVRGQALRLTSQLQTTLEVEDLIKIYCDHLQALVPFDGARFRHQVDGIELTIGTTRRHKCNYRLVLADTDLGELELTRARRFSPAELDSVENLLCTLLYPLRNAQLYRQALRAALVDPLTGVQNRGAMDLALGREVDLARRHRRPLAVIALDIDYFKSINDQLGHSNGDEVLRAVAHQVSAAVRRSDTLFRYGGEEFFIILSNTDQDGALRLAERVRRAVQSLQKVYAGRPTQVTISVGVAQLARGDTPDSLFDKADAALYRAKAEGRNCVRLWARARHTSES